MRWAVVFWGILLFLYPAAIAHKPKYDLFTSQAYARYLPERLRTLVSYVKSHDIKSACTFVQDDQDLDSYLFIIDAQKPYKFLAYSREKKLVNKTAQELQTQLPSTTFGPHSMDVIFDRIVSIAHKCDTYVACKFHFNQNNPWPYQIAYVHEYRENNKSYVLGAALFAEYSLNYFVVPHRVKAVARRIEKEGLENSLSLLTHDPDPDGYFYLIQRTYPFRYIVGGDSDEFIHKTSEDEQQMVFRDCKDPRICDMTIWRERMSKIAQAGGGFFAYTWPSKNASSVKVAYVYPIEYRKQKYMLCSGFRLENVPNDLDKILVDRVERYLAMIGTIGLENAVSVGHKENTPDSYAFIHEFQEPYSIILYSDRNVEGKTAADLQKSMLARCDGKTSCSNAIDVIAQEVALAKEGGGFYAYSWQTEEIPPKTFVKVSYLKPFVYNGKNYYVGSGYLIK